MYGIIKGPLFYYDVAIFKSEATTMWGECRALGGIISTSSIPKPYT